MLKEGLFACSASGRHATTTLSSSAVIRRGGLATASFAAAAALQPPEKAAALPPRRMNGLSEPASFRSADRASVQRNLLRDAALNELRLVLELGAGWFMSRSFGRR